MHQHEEKPFDGSALGAVGSRFYKFATARMKGQKKAIERLARALDWANSPLRKRTKPIFTVLLIGEDGSGKTHLIKLLAEFWLGASGAFTLVPCRMFFSAEYTQYDIDEFDLTYRYENDKGGHFREYMDCIADMRSLESRLKHLRGNLSKKGKKNDKKGEDVKQLRAAIKKAESELEKANKRMLELNEIGQNVLRNLRSIVVFDRLEEADPVVQGYLATLCEYARLQFVSEAGERNVSFVNSIVIITSNNCIPHDFRVGGFSGLGMRVPESKKSKDNYVRGMPEVKANFDCKFLSRLDRVEILEDYGEDDLIGVVDMLLEELIQELMKRNLNISLFVSEEAKKLIVKEGSDHKEFGIWLLKKKFEKYITHQLSALILANDAKEGDAFSVECGEDGKSVKFIKKDIPQLPPPQ